MSEKDRIRNYRSLEGSVKNYYRILDQFSCLLQQRKEHTEQLPQWDFRITKERALENSSVELTLKFITDYIRQVIEGGN
jgi:hypothetical protein